MKLGPFFRAANHRPVFNLQLTLICFWTCYSNAVKLKTNHQSILQNNSFNRMNILADQDQATRTCVWSKHLRSVLLKTSSLNSNLFTNVPVENFNLKYCRKGLTCCSIEVEQKLYDESRVDFKILMQDRIIGLSHTFESRTSKFDKFFRELMKNARNDLHQMFKRTYGLLYEQNSDIFTKLFDDLSSYYNSPLSFTGNNSHNTLDNSIESFYQQLYQRMFQILNQPYHFDQTYFDCMSGKMDELKPFGDVPEKMKQQISRALVAAKTFHNGLMVGRDCIRQFMTFAPSGECHSAFMQMTHCSHCRGLPSIKPCKSFCLNVMTYCLSDQVQFDYHWNDFLNYLIQLLDRLQGPLNIESVIDPINIKISDAIMTFQDKGKEITDKIFEGCGSPKVTKRKRSADVNRETFSAPVAVDDHAKANSATRSALDQLIKDIREKVTLAKEFWRNLPEGICSNPKISHVLIGKACWNEGNKNRSLNSEHETRKMDIRDPLLAEQVHKLKAMSLQLRKAYDAQSTDRVSTGATSNGDKKLSGDSSDYEGSGSAPTIEDGDDDDDEEEYDDDENERNSGNGHKPRTRIKASSPVPPTDDEDILQRASGEKRPSGEEYVPENSGSGPDSTVSAISGVETSTITEGHIDFVTAHLTTTKNEVPSTTTSLPATLVDNVVPALVLPHAEMTTKSPPSTSTVSVPAYQENTMAIDLNWPFAFEINISSTESINSTYVQTSSISIDTVNIKKMPTTKRPLYIVFETIESPTTTSHTLPNRVNGSHPSGSSSLKVATTKTTVFVALLSFVVVRMTRLLIS